MRLKILTANIAFGLPSMNRLLTNVRGHLAVHRLPMVTLFVRPKSLHGRKARANPGRVRYLERHSDLGRILSLIKKEDSDIVVLNEVILQLHKDELLRVLPSLGYVAFAWGPSGHHPDATVTSLIASRIPGDVVPMEFRTQLMFGGGGGTAALRLSEGNITVAGVHLSLPEKFPSIYEKQIEDVAKFARREKAEGRGVIAAGDWNASSSFIGKHGGFSGLGLVNADGDVPTCPTFFRKLKPLDHIFIPEGWKSSQLRVADFGSDHLAVAVSVETSP